MTVIAVCHTLHYRYDRPVLLGPHCLRLRPSLHGRLPIVRYALAIQPQTAIIHWQEDVFGNQVARVVFAQRITELRVRVDLIVDWIAVNPLDILVAATAECYPFPYESQLVAALSAYREVVEDGPQFQAFLATVERAPRATLRFLADANEHVWRHVQYAVRLDAGVQTCETTVSRRLGSCRDTAWLLVQLLRHLGFAARFVSGYLIEVATEPLVTGEDRVALHAWVEVYVPGAGWIGLDPTSGLFAGAGHVRLACASAPALATPIDGTCELCAVEWDVTQTIRRGGAPD